MECLVRNKYTSRNRLWEIVGKVNWYREVVEAPCIKNKAAEQNGLLCDILYGIAGHPRVGMH